MVSSHPTPCHRVAAAGSLLVCAGVVVASTSGLVAGERLTGESALVLVSRGADAANLLLVPLVIGAMWSALRGSLVGMLIWPGALFYCLYAYVPALVGAEFSWLFFVHVGLVTGSAFTVIGIVGCMDTETVRGGWSPRAARVIGAALATIALAAFAGLAASALGALGDPGREAAMRPLAVADWAVGTPALLAGGVLLWLRAPMGYAAAPGLLLVSALGGAVFAMAAVIDNAAAGPQTDAAVIAVHVVVSMVSLALLAFALREASSPRKAEAQP